MPRPKSPRCRTIQPSRRWHRPRPTSRAGGRGLPALTAPSSSRAKQASAAPTSLHNTGGLAGGLDYQFGPDVLAGFAVGGSSSNFAVRDGITSGHLEGAHFGGYGVKTWG